LTAAKILVSRLNELSEYITDVAGGEERQQTAAVDLFSCLS
jgi:hypothetical protein